MDKILIIKLSAIGDVIHALPTAHALKTALPTCKITWVVERPSYPLVAANRYIDEVVVFDKPRCKSWRGLVDYAPGFLAGLRKRRFDLALDLQGLFKSAAIAAGSGAKQRLVYGHARELSGWVSNKVVGQHAAGHIVEQYLDVVRALGINPPAADFGLQLSTSVIDEARQLAGAAGLDWNRDYAVLLPGANWPNKRWPPAHFAELSDRLYADGLIPVVAGSADDSVLAQTIVAAAAKPVIDLTGQTSLLHLAWLLENARLAVGGDTGPMHLAAALNTPTVMVMGPTDPKRNGPYGEGGTIVIRDTDCRYCWHRKCPYGHECLAWITPEALYKKIGYKC